MGLCFDVLRDALSQDRAVAVCTVVDGGRVGAKLVAQTVEPEITGDLGAPGLTAAVARDAAGILDSGHTGMRHYGPAGQRDRSEVSVFVQAYAPPPALYIFGAVDYTRALCSLGKLMGYRVTVCDPRRPFTTKLRFPDADEVIVDWPDRFLGGAPVDFRTVIAVLTHDPKLDTPALLAALRTDAGYIGAMGSRRTTEARRERLIEAGASDKELARIQAPIGLDIGARTPEETALSIMGEVVALRSGRLAASLSDSPNPIHPR